MTPSRARHIVDQEVFRLILHLEIQKASRLRYSICVIALSPDMPSEEANRGLSSTVAEASLIPLRGTDVATILPDSSVALLLVDAEAPTLQGILERASRSINEAASNVTGVARRLSLSAGASCYPQTATTEDELIGQAEIQLTRARAQGGDRLCLSHVGAGPL